MKSAAVLSRCNLLGLCHNIVTNPWGRQARPNQPRSLRPAPPRRSGRHHSIPAGGLGSGLSHLPHPPPRPARPRAGPPSPARPPRSRSPGWSRCAAPGAPGSGTWRAAGGRSRCHPAPPPAPASRTPTRCWCAPPARPPSWSDPRPRSAGGGASAAGSAVSGGAREGTGPAPGGLGHFRREVGTRRGQHRVGSAASGGTRPKAGPARLRGRCRAKKLGPTAGFFYGLIFDQKLVSCPVLNIISSLAPHRQLWPRRKLNRTKGKHTVTLPLNYRLNMVATPMTRMLHVLHSDTVKKAAANYSHIYS